MSHPYHTYTAADLRRYRDGDMTPAEMHALEAAALSDSFLSDALEGYQTKHHQLDDLMELQNRLATRIHKAEQKKAPVFFFRTNKTWRVAALVVLLAGIGWLAYRLPLSTQKDIALQESPVAKPKQERIQESISSDSISLGNPITNLSAEKALVVSALNTKIPSKKAVRTAAPQMAAPIQKTAALKESKDSADMILLQVDVAQRRVASPMVTIPTSTILRLNGKVMDSTGNAIPFASVAIPGIRTITQADKNGNFSLSAPDSVSTVVVSAAGYQSSQALLNPVAQNQVVLNRDNSSLQEVVVTMNKPLAKKRAAVTVTKGQLEPKEGWTRYNDYLAESLSEPEKIQTKPMSGEVTLSFDVNEVGEPINIQVEKSLCSLCDLKAIRLLKEGPKWKPGKGKKGSIVIHF